MPFRPVITAAAVGVLALTGGTALAPASATTTPAPYTCTGGDFSTGDFVHIPSGTYSRITVAGACDVEPGAVINVIGNLTVAPGAVFDAQSSPSTITIGRNVTAGSGALLGLGCQPPSLTGNSAHECVVEPEGNSTITVKGNVTATAANTVLLNGITVHRNVTLAGGGGQIPWAIKNNTIDGNLTISNVTVEWLGVLFNKINGNVTLTDITLTETHPDASGAVYIVRNTVGRNLNCFRLAPTVSGGFVPGSVNVVGRNANGQCADLV
jgi:hypothetical protein